MNHIAMSLSERREMFDATMQKLCFISIVDSGLSEEDVDRYVDEATTPAAIQDAVLEYARDYDLAVSGQGWVP